MSNVGLGVMLRALGGYEESVEALRHAIGKQISRAFMADDDALIFVFTDGSGIRFADEGQSCCESRYMTCGDDLSSCVGGALVSAELRDAPPPATNDGEEHEAQFLVIKTTNGDITAETHNEHNGYYGGFSVQCSAFTDGAPC